MLNIKGGKCIMRKMLRNILSFVLLLVLTMSLGLKADAKTYYYDTWASRGVKYVSWIKNSVSWSTIDDKKIRKVSKDQAVSGLFIVARGIKKEKSISNSQLQYFKCLNRFLVGAQLGGVTLGYKTDINDRVLITRRGGWCWYWDI